MPKGGNHPNFVNISSTIVIDTSMERSSRVATTTWKHKNLIFFFKKLEIEFWFVFCLTCFLFKFEIEFWLIFLLVPKRRNHSSRSQQAPIWRLWGCIVVPSSRVVESEDFFRIPTPDSDSSSFEKPTPALLKNWLRLQHFWKPDSDSSSFKIPTPTPTENMRLHRLPTPTPQP